MKKGAIVLALFAACAPKDFSPSSLVDSLRVLAVRADKSIAAPGESVHLDALVADPPHVSDEAVLQHDQERNHPARGEVDESNELVRLV